MLASVTYAIIEGPQDGWGSPLILGLFAISVAAAGTLVAVEWRRQDPLIDIRFFRSAPFSGATVIAVAAFATLGGFLFLNTLYLQDVRGYSPLDAGLLTIPMATMIRVFANVSGRLVGGRGPRLPLILAGPLAAGSLLLALLSPHTAVAYLVAAYIVFGMGSGLVMATITTAAVSGMPIAQAGVAGALASTSRQIGSALGVAVTGSIVAGGVGAGFVTSSHAAWVVMAGCGVAVLVVGLVSTGHWALGTARRNGQRLALGLKAGPIRAEEAIPLGRGARR